jgi:ketosteroid isomerase-like protein
MFTTFLILAASLAGETKTVDVDGDKVRYEVVRHDDGARRLTGKRLSDDAPFDLTVRPDGRVEGKVDGKKVSFRAPRG